MASVRPLISILDTLPISVIYYKRERDATISSTYVMPPSLFHASLIPLPVGKTLIAESRNVPLPKEKAEKILEHFRYGRSTSRFKAFFAASEPSDSFVYLKKEPAFELDSVHVYRVEMQAPSPHPMAMVNRVYKALLNKEDCKHLRHLAEEYWQPKINWKFLEYISSSMTVFEELPIPDSISQAGAIWRYQEDCREALQILPKN